MNLRWFLRSCAHCGLSLGVEKVFCDFCWHTHLPASSMCYRNSYFKDKFYVYSLFNWDESYEGKQVGKLIHLLKGGSELQSFHELALNFLQLRQLSSIEQDVVIVPSPPKHKQRPDHAVEWAQALSLYSGFPQKNALERINEEPQKNKTRKERLKLSHLVKLTQHKYSKVIFVDDVVTTGSTAMAAYRALGEPKFFEVWAIACRPNLFLV